MRYVSHLACSTCGATYAADQPRNLCATDGRPVQVIIDIERLRSEHGAQGWWNPARRDLWRFGGLLPLDINDPEDRRQIVCLGEGYTPSLPYAHPLAERLRCRLEVKDEGRSYEGFGANPTLSFKDRGMAMTVSMARALGLGRLAVPTQGNAGDALAEYAVAGKLQAAIVMSPETDLPVLGKVAALAALHPEHVTLELVPGTIIECGKRVRDFYVPNGYFNVATFQEPGWRTEGKKTLGLEMAEPRGEGWADRVWKLPDVIVYPTGGGTGVVGMAKAFDELEALGLVGPARPRMICVQSVAATPLVRAFEQGTEDITAEPAGKTLATGLNVAQNIGHINVLRIIRATGGCALSVSDEAIRQVIREEWRARRFAWSPEGAATLAVLPELADRGLIGEGDHVVLVNTASPEKYLPTIRDLFHDEVFPSKLKQGEASGRE
ncbi:MAG: threonine synthase [Isosphaeraceae bacterium]